MADYDGLNEVCWAGHRGEQPKNPIKAIRLKCLDCCCGSEQEVRLCTCEFCAVWPFRMGKNPYRTKREYTEEQKKAMRERLAKGRDKKAEETD